MLQLTNCTANNLCGSDSIFNNSPRFFRSNLGAKIGVKNMFQRWHFRPDKPITRQNQQIQYITVNKVWNYAVKTLEMWTTFLSTYFKFFDVVFFQTYSFWSAILFGKAVGPVYTFKSQKELVSCFNQKSSWPYTF